MITKKSFPVLSILMVSALCCIVACSTRAAKRLELLADAAHENNYLSAISTIEKNKDWYGARNAFLYNMDLGVLHHYAGLNDSSNTYLENAVQVNHELFTRSVTNEALSILTNDNLRPYRSKPYELVLAHEYLFLNYMALGKVEEALVESRRAQLQFNEWERKNTDGTKYTNDGFFHYLSSLGYESAGELDNAMISLFKSVRAYQQNGDIFPPGLQNYAYYRFRENDRNNDIQLLGLTADQPAALVPQLPNHQTEIVFIGYAGRGPALGETSWWGTYVKDGLLIVSYNDQDGNQQTITLPAPPLPDKEYEKADKDKKTRSGTTFHIKFAMPALKTFSSRTSYFSVNHPSFQKPVKSVVMSDYDQLAAKHLEDTKTSALTRTAIRVVLRTIAAESTKSEISGKNSFLNLLFNLGTDALSDQLEKADTRSCFLVPKTIQVARIPVAPGIHSVEASAHTWDGTIINTRQFPDLEVKPNRKVFIYYPCME